MKLTLPSEPKKDVKDGILIKTENQTLTTDVIRGQREYALPEDTVSVYGKIDFNEALL